MYHVAVSVYAENVVIVYSASRIVYRKGNDTEIVFVYANRIFVNVSNHGRIVFESPTSKSAQYYMPNRERCCQ